MDVLLAMAETEYTLAGFTETKTYDLQFTNMDSQTHKHIHTNNVKGCTKPPKTNHAKYMFN